MSTRAGRWTRGVTAYKLGDKYVASRSNKFGYANYAVEAVREW